jgi:GT2 family glycosyltransferase
MNASHMEKLNKKLTSSVIICTKDREKDLLECVDSIKAQTLLPKELVIVDAGKENGIKTNLEEKLKKTPLELKYIRTPPGLTRQRNIGVKNSSGDIVLFFDDDVILDKDYLKNILNVYSSSESDGKIGGVSGKMTNVKPPKLLIRIFRKIFLLSPYGMLPPGFFDHNLSPQKISKVRIFSGCNMSYTREVLENFKFDENLKGYAFMEDVDFSFRVSQNFTLIQTSDATLIHKLAPVSRDGPKKRVEMEMSNTSYLFKKNMPENFKNFVLFIWSRLGVFLWMLFMGLKERNAGWVLGFIQGLKTKKSYAKD